MPRLGSWVRIPSPAPTLKLSGPERSFDIDARCRARNENVTQRTCHPEVRATASLEECGRGAEAVALRGPRCARAPQGDGEPQLRRGGQALAIPSKSVLAARRRPSFAPRSTKNPGPIPSGGRRRWYRHPSRSRPAHEIRKAKRRQTRNHPSASTDAAARPDLSVPFPRAGRAGRGALACRRSTAALAAANQRRRSAPERASWDAAVAGVSCISPLPVQRAPRRPVMVPAGRFPEPPGNGSDEPPPAGTALAPAAGVTRLPSYTRASFVISYLKW